MQQQLGHYRLDRELSRGGMGVVYVGWDTRANRKVAIKRVLRAGQPQRLARFLREAELLAKLDHPNVVKVHELGVESEPFLVMEFVEGESLQALLDRDGPFPPRRAVEIARDLGRALEHAHGRDVLHRDLKPDNVLLTPAGAPILVDFGLTRDTESSSLTSTGHALGTPGFWAPEQAVGMTSKVGPRSDVFGLGATLYALVEGSAPFVGESLPAQVMGMEHGASTLEADPGLDAICQRAMAFEPRHRYPSAAEFVAELERWLQGERLTVDLRPRGKRARRTLWVAAPALLAVALVGWLAAQPPPGQSREAPTSAVRPEAKDDGPASDPATLVSSASDPAPAGAPYTASQPFDPNARAGWSLTPFHLASAPDRVREAWLVLAKDSPSVALHLLNGYLAEQPRDPEGLLWRSVVQARLSSFEAARADATLASQLRPDDPRPHAVLYRVAVRTLDYEGVKQAEQEGTRKSVGVRGAFAEVLQLLGEHTRAAHELTGALQERPQDPRLNATLAAVSYEGDREGSLAAFARVDRALDGLGLPLPVESLPPLWSRKVVREYLKREVVRIGDVAATDVEEAERLLRRLQLSLPDDVRILFRLTKIAFDRDDYEGCLTLAAEWRERSPGDHRAQFYEGKSLRRLGRLDEALPPLNLAAEKGHQFALKERGEVQFLLERWAEAHADMQSYLEWDPEHLGAQLTRAMAAAKLGRLDEARADLRRFEADERFERSVNRQFLDRLRNMIRTAERTKSR